LLNSAQVGPTDIFVELGSLVVGETKPRFRRDAEIEREDWSAPNILPVQSCALSRSGEALAAHATKPKHQLFHRWIIGIRPPANGRGATKLPKIALRFWPTFIAAADMWKELVMTRSIAVEMAKRFPSMR
jgi:hypothetical protein